MSSCIYDVVVIGGGVTGCSVARELSRYHLHTCLLEREEDVCSGTSKANSAIVHAGYDAANGSLKAMLNVQGNEMMEQLSNDLQFDFKRNGSMVLCFDENDLPALKEFPALPLSQETRPGKRSRMSAIRWWLLSMRLPAELYVPSA